MLENNQLVQKAEEFATIKHNNQTRWDGSPYINHPKRIAQRFTDSTLKCVALLHDILEDTNTSYDELAKLFGKDIADMVFVLTRKSNETYDDFINSIIQSGNLNVIKIKIADIKDNTYDIRLYKNKESLAKRYDIALRKLKAALPLDNFKEWLEI